MGRPQASALFAGNKVLLPGTTNLSGLCFSVPNHPRGTWRKWCTYLRCRPKSASVFCSTRLAPPAVLKCCKERPQLSRTGSCSAHGRAMWADSTFLAVDEILNQQVILTCHQIHDEINLLRATMDWRRSCKIVGCSFRCFEQFWWTCSKFAKESIAQVEIQINDDGKSFGSMKFEAFVKNTASQMREYLRKVGFQKVVVEHSQTPMGTAVVAQRTVADKPSDRRRPGSGRSMILCWSVSTLDVRMSTTSPLCRSRAGPKLYIPEDDEEDPFSPDCSTNN